MILIHPPVVKPCEPPAGIARLLGTLRRHGYQGTLLDANLEGISFLLGAEPAASDTWTSRAARHLSRNLSWLRNRSGYENLDQYRRAVLEVNRLLEKTGKQEQVQVNLSNYHDRHLSPVRSQDLIRAAENPERNPFYRYFRTRLLGLLESHSPALVGFSLNYLSQALCTFAMIGFLRKECASLSIVLGGGLITAWMRKLGWRNPFQGLVDHCVAGPGEGPLLALLGSQSGTDRYSCPNYDPFVWEDYLAPGRILPYSTASGCYWNRCAFCPESVQGNSYRPIPVDQVTREVQDLVQRMNPGMVHFLDNALSLKTLKEFIKNPPGAPWYGFARLTPDLIDPDFCQALRRSGCRMLQLGLESGDQGVLDALQKGIDLQAAARGLKNLAKAGVVTYVYLLFGTLAETLREARRTLDFVAENGHSIGFLNLAIFNLPVDSPEAGQVATKMFYEGDLSLYTDFCHPRGWDRKSVREFLDQEFKKNSRVKSILRKDPPVFTSNHAPFFL